MEKVSRNIAKLSSYIKIEIKFSQSIIMKIIYRAQHERDHDAETSQPANNDNGKRYSNFYTQPSRIKSKFSTSTPTKSPGTDNTQHCAKSSDHFLAADV